MTQDNSRALRPTHYGNPVQQEDVMKKSYTTTALTPLTDELAPYGGKIYRTPRFADEFTGQKGSAIPAYIFDIDGTLQGYGQGAQKKVLEWAEKLYAKDPDAVFLVITARDHGSFGYKTSFDWLMKNFPYPFIGPFARPVDDPQFTTEFKRNLAQGFEDMGLYQIMGAADDNAWVIKMWKQWAIDHFENPEDFDLLECSYGDYSGWRKDLPSTTARTYASYSTPGHTYDSYGTGSKYVAPVAANAAKNGTHKGETWVNGSWDKEGKNWVQGRWVKDEVAPAHRQAGVSRWAQNDRQELEELIDEAEDQEEREVALTVVNEWFNDRFTPAELELLSIDELNDLIDMTDPDAEEFIDARYDQVYGGKGSKEEIARIQLEEEVFAEYQDLSYRDIEEMSTKELELLLDTAVKLNKPVAEIKQAV